MPVRVRANLDAIAKPDFSQFGPRRVHAASQFLPRFRNLISCERLLSRSAVRAGNPLSPGTPQTPSTVHRIATHSALARRQDEVCTTIASVSARERQAVQEAATCSGTRSGIHKRAAQVRPFTTQGPQQLPAQDQISPVRGRAFVKKLEYSATA